MAGAASNLQLASSLFRQLPNTFLLRQDKACIDQNNIDQSLACLPVFLSGCQILLIVAGPTYCSRLWCVMEIFTFMRMGGAMDRIDVELITHPDQDRVTRAFAAKRELMEQLATFDAAKAQCFKQADRQRLLAVIEAGFGNFDEFNQSVRIAFDGRMRVQRVRKLRKAFRAGSSPKPALGAEALAAAKMSSAKEVELSSKGAAARGCQPLTITPGEC